MKKLCLAFLISIFILPALVPWVPDGALQTFHVQQELHHGVSADHANMHNHNNDNHARQNINHSIHFDVVSYFSDYLHVDLQNSNQIVLTAPPQDMQGIDFVVTTDLLSQRRYELASVQSRAPPDWRIPKPDNTPLYLSTQRLRI